MDHKALAADLIAYHRAESGSNWTPASDSEVFALAQVHATLALVEQQRVANLLALFHLADADVADFGTRGVIWPQVANEVVAGLGLA